MKLTKHTLLTLTFLSSAFFFAQEKTVKRIKKEYDNLAYVKTSEVLLEVAKNGYESRNLLQKLGNSFYFNNKMEDAAKWYSKLMDLNEEVDSEYYFRYAQALKFNENYTKADIWMQKFHESNPEDSRGKAFVSRDDYLDVIEASSSRDKIVVRNLEINSKFSDFGTTQYNNQIVIASTRGSGKLYEWNEQPYLDLYSAQEQDDGSYGNLFQFSETVNTKYHESTASFSPDESTMYFTRNDFFKKKLGKDRLRYNRLQIYKATRQTDNTWDDVQPIHFNSSKYSVAHPVVNATGTKVYFASDMPGTVGQSDIYVASINNDGSLGDPTNLGNTINTEGKESFPYINAKGDLYFSSNGFPGLGGLDVYVIRDFEATTTNSMSQNFIVENIGKPINSAQDDFCYYENLGTKEGFFTSNRPGGKGDDDVYAFNVLECAQAIEGVVKDVFSKELISEATVILFDVEGKEVATKTTDDNGGFTFNVDCEKQYLVRASKPIYETNEKRVTTPYSTKALGLKLLLKKDEQEVAVGDDLSKVLDIPIIYFDIDKYNIRPDAAVELQKVITVLNQNLSMKIDVRSHTDSRAREVYNKTLSIRRNRSTIAYLVNIGGIDSNRITGNGYGESQLVNNCSDSVKCTEAEHELNRRSEFIIMNN